MLPIAASTTREKQKIPSAAPRTSSDPSGDSSLFLCEGQQNNSGLSISVSNEISGKKEEIRKRKGDNRMKKSDVEHKENLSKTALRRYQTYKELFLKQKDTADDQNRKGK